MTIEGIGFLKILVKYNDFFLSLHKLSKNNFISNKKFNKISNFWNYLLSVSFRPKISCIGSKFCFLSQTIKKLCFLHQLTRILTQ